jgi:hypothetical protein
MGQPDQFAKRTFASDAEQVTHGGVVWKAPPEVGLIKVQADGLLLVKDPARLVGLAEPWPSARLHTEIQLELKMPGDHTDATVTERGLLRRQARQVERMEEKQKPPWRGQEPLWFVAPHLPEELAEQRALSELAPGCHRVDTGAKGFDFFWIAANELPLCEELIPFLVVRSGRALDEFGRWVVDHRPMDWVMDMIKYTNMSTTVQTELLQRYEPSDDPQVHAREIAIARRMCEVMPEATVPIQLRAARSRLRRVLARRGLVTSAEDEARIDACDDLATLERWLDETITATSAAEALR